MANKAAIERMLDEQLPAARARGRAVLKKGPRAVAVARLAVLSGSLPRGGADCIQVPVRRGPIPIVTPRFVRAAHRAGLPVHVWTVNASAAMDELLELAVDGLMTDRPSVLREVLARRGHGLEA